MSGKNLEIYKDAFEDIQDLIESIHSTRYEELELNSEARDRVDYKDVFNDINQIIINVEEKLLSDH